jgi:hypothetical protein
MTDMKLLVLVALLHLLAYVTATPQILTDNSFGNQVQVTLCHDFNYNEDASPADSIACQETRLLTPGKCYSISDAAPGSSWIWADGLSSAEFNSHEVSHCTFFETLTCGGNSADITGDVPDFRYVGPPGGFDNMAQSLICWGK